MCKLFTGYGILNWFLLLGILTAPIDHTEVFTFLSVGILLPLLDALDMRWGTYWKTETKSKIIWISFMIVLIIEAIYFYI